MSKRKILVISCILGLLTGCLGPTDSNVNELASAQKPEGFLMVSDIVADKTISGSFVVTCLNQSGKSTQEIKTKADIEKNLICKQVAVTTSNTSTSTGPAVPAAPKTATGFKVSFTSKLESVSFLKAKAGVSISKKSSTGTASQGSSSGIDPAYQEFRDYCVVPKEFVAEKLCMYSASEYKATNAKIDGCKINLGYLFISHFTISPTLVPACQ